MRVYGGTMRRVIAALVLTVLTGVACGGSSGESQGRSSAGARAAEGTTTSEAPSVAGVQATPSVPVVPVTPSLQVPPATASVPAGGSRGGWPRRGSGCRRAPYPRCSVTTRRPCCRPGDPANARFNAQRPAGA